LVLAIDLGTGGPKVAVVARDGRILSSAATTVDTLYLPHDGAEQDAGQVWTAVLDTCSEVLSGVAAEKVIGITVCSQYSSIVPVNDKGEPVMNMVLWMDKRGAPVSLAEYPGGERFKNTILRKMQWIRAHGIPPLESGKDSLAHMRWIMLARPDVYMNTRWFLEPMDYITMRLTDNVRATPCSAFLMLLVDNRNLESPRYDPSLIKLAGIDIEKLPPLGSVDEQVGEITPLIAARLGLRRDVKVWSGINDTQAGGMASYSFKGSHAGLSIGTTSVLVTKVPFKRTDIRNSLVSMPSPIPGTWFIMAENGLGGRAIEHFLEKIVFCSDSFGDHSLEDKFAMLDRAVQNVAPGGAGLLFLPWLDGSFAPVEDTRARGGFLNMSLATSREQLARSVLEGVALNLRWLTSAVEKFARHDITHLVFYGGGALSDAWSQIIADVLQVPVHQVSEPRLAICRGLGLLGFQRQGLIDLDDYENLTPLKMVYDPRRELAPVYGQMFTRFLRAFKYNRKLFRNLDH
jgi:xylulokinase